jgi:hypothetical protein
MNLDRLNQWLSLAANAGVIAGFVLLAVQMKQNTDALQLQNQIELGRGAMTTDLAAMGDNVYVANTTSILEPSKLTDEQIYQLLVYIDSIMNVAWNTWLAYRAGDATEDSWNAALEWVGYFFSYDAAKLVWNRYKEGYPKPFVDAVDASLARHGDAMHQALKGAVVDIRNLGKRNQPDHSLMAH